MMKRLRRDAEKSPVSNIAILLLLVIGFASFPIRDTIEMFTLEYTQINRYLFTALFRAVFAGVMIYLVRAYQFDKTLTFRAHDLWKTLPCFLVVINNFPIIALATGAARIDASAGVVALYLVQTLAITAFEELAFRGILFPLCWMKLKKRKYSVLWAAALSGALFGATHLINLIGGAAFLPVLLQVGYSFLIGAMCALATVMTKSLLVPVMLHFLFNAGGLLVSELGAGEILNTPTVFITVILAALVTTYMIYVAVKTDGKEMENLLSVPEDPTDRANGETENETENEEV